MPTAPNFEEVERTLKQLLSLSQAILNCDEQAIERFQQLLDERETLISTLKETPASAFQTESERALLDRLTQELQTIDRMAEERFKGILQHHAQALCQISTVRQALNNYKFPSVTHHSGIESEG